MITKLDRMMLPCKNCGCAPTLSSFRPEGMPDFATEYHIYCSNPWCNNKLLVGDVKVFSAIDVWNKHMREDIKDS